MKGGRIIVRESDDGNDAVKITRDADEGYVQLFSSGSQTVELRGNGASYFNGSNVGIGVSSPVGTLSVSTTTAGENVFRAEGVAGSLFIDHAGAGNNLYDAANHKFRDFAGNEHMRLDSSGNLGLGTSTMNTTLNLYSSSNTQIGFQDASTGNGSADGFRIGYNGTYGQLWLFEDADFRIATNNTERLRISSTGLTTIKRTGITGVTKNDMTLQIGYEGNNGQNNLIGFGYNAGNAIPAYIGYTTTSGSSNTKGAIVFGTRDVVTDSDPSERMRITSGGDVEIAPISGSSVIDYGMTLAPQSGYAQIYLRANSTSTTYLQRFYNESSGVLQNVGNITISGSSTNYVTSSDYRLKENVVSMTDALDRVSQLKPSRFNFIADADKTVDGFLAHEVQDIVPEAITGEKDAMQDEEYEITPAKYKTVVHPAEDAVYETIEHPAIEEELDDEGNVIVEGKEAYTEEILVTEAKEEWSEEVLESEAVMGTRQVPDYQGIDQSKLVPLLVGAIQELEARVKELEKEI